MYHGFIINTNYSRLISNLNFSIKSDGLLLLMSSITILLKVYHRISVYGITSKSEAANNSIQKLEFTINPVISITFECV